MDDFVGKLSKLINNYHSTIRLYGTLIGCVLPVLIVTRPATSSKQVLVSNIVFGVLLDGEAGHILTRLTIFENIYINFFVVLIVIVLLLTLQSSSKTSSAVILMLTVSQSIFYIMYTYYFSIELQPIYDNYFIPLNLIVIGFTHFVLLLGVNDNNST